MNDDNADADLHQVTAAAKLSVPDGEGKLLQAPTVHHGQDVVQGNPLCQLQVTGASCRHRLVGDVEGLKQELAWLRRHSLDLDSAHRHIGQNADADAIVSTVGYFEDELEGHLVGKRILGRNHHATCVPVAEFDNNIANPTAEEGSRHVRVSSPADIVALAGEFEFWFRIWLLWLWLL